MKHQWKLNRKENRFSGWIDIGCDGCSFGNGRHSFVRSGIKDRTFSVAAIIQRPSPPLWTVPHLYLFMYRVAFCEHGCNRCIALALTPGLPTLPLKNPPFTGNNLIVGGTNAHDLSSSIWYGIRASFSQTNVYRQDWGEGSHTLNARFPNEALKDLPSPGGGAIYCSLHLNKTIKGWEYFLLHRIRADPLGIVKPQGQIFSGLPETRPHLQKL